MGEWDLLELEDLFKSENFDYQEAGFEIADLNALDIELFSTENLTLEESTLIAKEPNLSQEQRADIVKDMKKTLLKKQIVEILLSPCSLLFLMILCSLSNF